MHVPGPTLAHDGFINYNKGKTFGLSHRVYDKVFIKALDTPDRYGANVGFNYQIDRDFWRENEK